LVAWWWVFFLGSHVVERGFSILQRRAREVDELATATQVGLLADAAELVVAILAAFLVHRVTEMQEQARRRVLSIS
jgi:hypothetical protein